MDQKSSMPELATPPRLSSEGTLSDTVPATRKSRKKRREQIAWWARQAITKWERDGLWSAVRGAVRKLIRRSQNIEVRYDQWIASCEPSEVALQEQRQTDLAITPKISLIAAPEVNSLVELPTLIKTLQAQTYSNWELCVALEKGERNKAAAIVAKLELGDLRVKLIDASTSDAAERLNMAVSAAEGTWLAVVDASDVLAPFALFEIVAGMERHPGVDLIYSDEDQIDDDLKTRRDPVFKPNWSPDLLRSFNYLGRLTVIERKLVERVGPFRTDLPGAFEYDLNLRLTEKAKQIVHIPQVLCHQRPQTQFGRDRMTDPIANEAARQAIGEHLARCDRPGTVRHGSAPGRFHVEYKLPQHPLVSIIIPNRDQVDVLARCIDSLWRTDYENFEIVIVENGSRDPRTHQYYTQLLALPRVKIVRFTEPFNYSAVVNWGVANSNGDVVVQLNNDTQVINSDWLERMLEHATRPEVGAVGAKLYFPDNDRIQHAGAVVGLGGGAGHPFIDEPGDSVGYAGRLITIQNVSSVTGACLMTRRNVYDEVGGLDESFPLDCNDADFCLKIRKHGYFNVWTPRAELYHFESLTRGAAPSAERLALLESAVTRFRKKWPNIFDEGDPFYNPNLSLNAGGYKLRLDAPPVRSRAA